MGRQASNIDPGRCFAALTLAVSAALCGCQSLAASLDRLVPPWGPPEQWEPSYSKSVDSADEKESRPNYAAIFEDDAE